MKRFESASDFLATTGQFLCEREAEHNLILGLAHALTGTDIDPNQVYLGAVGDGDDVTLAALRAGHHLVLSCTDGLDAVSMLAGDVLEACGRLSGVNGPGEVARPFAEQWCEATGVWSHLHGHHRIYRTQSVILPEVPGSMRPVAHDDRDVLVDWVDAFAVEAEGRDADPQAAATAVDQTLAHDPHAWALWQVEGRAVSMAAVTGPTPQGIRINRVYTPPELRGRGYASACVATLTRRELQHGREFVFLYTNLDNPTSNRIYQRIGYQPIVDIEVRTFHDPPHGPAN